MSRGERIQLVFTIALAVLGWGALAVWLADGSGPIFGDAGADGVAMFAIIILATRALAVPTAPGTVLSLDSGFYVAAAVTLGARGAGLLVALALTADAAARWGWARRRGDREGPGLPYVAYFGGGTGALVTGVTCVVSAIAPGPAGDDLGLCLRVVAIGFVVLVIHNLIQGVRVALVGRSLAGFLREQAGPGIVAELSLMPVASVAALVFLDGHRLGFGLLGATHLVLNLMFNRLARASAGGRARVRELELLDRTARALGSSIELEQVVATVARETAHAIAAADSVALIHRGAAREIERLVIDRYEPATELHARQVIPRGDDVATGGVRAGRPLRIADLSTSGVALGALAGPGQRSWLGVPVMMHGVCEGVLAVGSRAPSAFTEADERLLGSLALQVGAALANAHLYEMAMVDGLTGLFVRRYFDARLDEEIERARRYGAPFAVAMLDLDDFKRLNDEHGHLIGDRVLREVALAIKDEVRGVDTAARLGGEELALILPGLEVVAALAHGERVRSAIARRPVAVDGGPVLHITSSIGLAVFPPCGATTAEELLRCADRALYRAKRAGKDRVEVYWDDSGPHQALTGS